MAKFIPWLFKLHRDIEKTLESFYEDLEVNYFADKQGAKYSPDKKRLLSLPKEIDTYTVIDGTEILFGDCSSSHLQTLILPDSVIAVWDDVFCGCDSLCSIIFGKGLKYIGERSFAGCSFTTVDLPEGLEVIKDESFTECKFLTTLRIPSSVTSIGKNAFANCPHLNCIYIEKDDLEKFKRMMPYYDGWYKFFNNKEDDSLTKKQIPESFIEAAKKAQYMKSKRKSIRGSLYDLYCLESEYNRSKELDEDNWYAMTDGQYGDYPEKGFDGDYESLGF